jgi:hypothetical protein
MSLWEEIAKARAQLKSDATVRHSENKQTTAAEENVVAAPEREKPSATPFFARSSPQNWVETSLGTVANPFMAAEEAHSAPQTASVSVSFKEQSILPLQGAALSDQEWEDRAAGLTPEQAKHAAEACVDTLEWLLGLEMLIVISYHLNE